MIHSVSGVGIMRVKKEGFSLIRYDVGNEILIVNASDPLCDELPYKSWVYIRYEQRVDPGKPDRLLRVAFRDGSGVVRVLFREEPKKIVQLLRVPVVHPL
jgi:hypothetical protein